MESRGRGVLDAPVKPGHDTEGGDAAARSFAAERAETYAAAVIGRGLTTYSRSTLSLASTSISETS